MDKTIIGLLFILAGLMYGSLAMDNIYNITLGYLVKNSWIKPPLAPKKEKDFPLGRKGSIIFYSILLIIIGIFIIWNRKI